MIHIDVVVLNLVGVPLSIGVPQSMGLNPLVMALVLSFYHSELTWYNLHSVYFGNHCMVT